MEKDQYLPGTEVALQLARTLGASVEDLFSLHDGREILEAELACRSFRGFEVHQSQVGDGRKSSGGQARDGTGRRF